MENNTVLQLEKGLVGKTATITADDIADAKGFTSKHADGALVSNRYLRWTP